MVGPQLPVEIIAMILDELDEHRESFMYDHPVILYEHTRPGYNHCGHCVERHMRTNCYSVPTQFYRKLMQAGFNLAGGARRLLYRNNVHFVWRYKDLNQFVSRYPASWYSAATYLCKLQIAVDALYVPDLERGTVRLAGMLQNFAKLEELIFDFRWNQDSTQLQEALFNFLCHLPQVKSFKFIRGNSPNWVPANFILNHAPNLYQIADANVIGNLSTLLQHRRHREDPRVADHAAKVRKQANKAWRERVENATRKRTRSGRSYGWRESWS